MRDQPLTTVLFRAVDTHVTPAAQYGNPGFKLAAFKYSSIRLPSFCRLTPLRLFHLCKFFERLNEQNHETVFFSLPVLLLQSFVLSYWSNDQYSRKQNQRKYQREKYEIINPYFLPFCQFFKVLFNFFLCIPI